MGKPLGQPTEKRPTWTGISGNNLLANKVAQKRCFAPSGEALSKSRGGEANLDCIYYTFLIDFFVKHDSVWCQINMKSAITIQIWIVITHFYLISYQTGFCLVPVQSEKCNYNPNLV